MAKDTPKPTEAEAEVSYPDPVLPKRGRTSKYSGVRFIANPKLTGNPRNPGTAGHVFHEIVRAAGSEGLTYEELKAAVKDTKAEAAFSLHVKYEIEEKHFTVIK